MPDPKAKLTTNLTVLKKPPPTDVLLACFFLKWAKDKKPCQGCSGNRYKVKTTSVEGLTLVCKGCGHLLIFSREKVLELVRSGCLEARVRMYREEHEVDTITDMFLQQGGTLN